MKKQLLFIILCTIGSLYVLQAQNTCNADTTFFKLPQNEFNTSNGWFVSPAENQKPWSGGISFYNMYDPCVAESNTLIISEVTAAAGNFGTYMELTNIGDQPIDLSNYRVIGQRNEKTYPNVKISRMANADLSGTLNPGESYLLMGFQNYANTEKGVMDRVDTLSQHNSLLAEIANLKYPINTNGSSLSYYVGRGHDILGSTYNYNVCLAKIVGDTSEVIVDVFEQLFVEGGRASIAGVPNAAGTYTVVRKQFTNGRTYGNPNFAISSGAEAAEASEWILIPRFRNGTSHLPTTIGSHNSNSQYSLSSKPGATIDEQNSIITLPWGTYKGDSIISLLNVGADMAWSYNGNDILEEQVSNLAHSFDSITFYHCGVDVTIKTYRIMIETPADDLAMAISKNRNSDFARMYNETQGLATDTIYGSRLTFDYPVDTLLKYIEISETSTMEIIWKDGDDKRPTLKNGDILKVTSKNGNTHNYFIGLVPYDQNGLSHDARIITITWPDYPVDDLDPYLWTTNDTLPGFNKEGYSYVINLPAGTTQVPALKATCNNPRASYKVTPATNLYGSVSDQTTTFKVTAEDDSTTANYAFRFIVETDDWAYEGQPFFSEVSRNTSASVMLEICNPGNVLLDLSDYVVVHGKYKKKTLAGAFAWDASNFYSNTKVYRPGYVFDSLNMSSNQMMWFDPNGDSDVDSYVEPGGVFTIATEVGGGAFDTGTGLFKGSGNGIIAGPNVILHSDSNTKDWSWNKHGGNAYGLVGRLIYDGTNYQNACNTFWLLKIANDSVKYGTKGVIDPADFEVIDIIGKVESAESYGWMNAYTGKPLSPAMAGAHIRKPRIHKGNPVSTGSFGYAEIGMPTVYDVSAPLLGDTAAYEWLHVEQTPYSFDLGRHTLTPVTSYKSTISSTAYKVTLGFSMDEEISGVTSGIQATDFLNNIIKIDAEQELQLSTSDGSLIFDFDVLQEGDLLSVTSADGNNTTKYTIHIGELNSDVSLSSTIYTVSESEITLTDITTTLKTMVANLTISKTSMLYVLDKRDNLVPFINYNVRDLAYYDAVASGDLRIKVVAQTGDYKIYTIVLPSASSDAYITSSIYQINNGEKLINGVVDGINVENLLNNITVCTGAKATVINKWAQAKEFGIILFNDVIKVVSADGTNTVYYGITLNSEVEPEIILSTTEIVNPDIKTVYPNPTTGVINFNTVVDVVKIYDITGRLVMQKTETSKIDISNFINGIYILSISGTDNASRTVKITKQ